MFKNVVEVRGSAALSGSKLKQLQARLTTLYPNLSRDDWTSLLGAKPAIALEKTEQSTHRAAIYIDANTKQPLLFQPNPKDDLVLPTVYTLWHFPNMLRKLVIPGLVHARLLSGADLMIPGLQHGSNLEGVLVNDVVAIHVLGHEPAIAVGVMLLDEAAIMSSGGYGKCTKIHHVFGDGLWKHGDRSVPNETFSASAFTRQEPVRSLLPNAESEIADALELSAIDSGDVLAETAESAEELVSVSSDAVVDEPLEDPKQALESAVMAYLASASIPVALGEVADAVVASDPRLNIRSTAFRTWDVLFRGFAKRGLIKVKDGIIVSINAVHLQPKTAPADQDPEIDVQHMDELLEYALLTSLRGRIKDSDLPMLASVVSDHVRASTSNTLNLKHSSYKSFTKLLKTFAKRDLIKLKEHKSGLILISVNRDTEELRGDPSDSNTDSKPKLLQPKRPADFSKISVLTKYEPNKHVRFLFGSIPSKALFSLDDCKQRLQTYLQEHDLRLEQGMVRLDDTLKEALFHGSENCPETISMKDLNVKFETQFIRYSAIVSGNEEPVFSKGTPPSIEVVVERVGQKIRTVVRNLEVFGLDPVLVAQQCQKRFACSATTKQLPRKTKIPLHEVLIQGRFDKEVCTYFKSELGVPLHLIEVNRKKV